MDNILIPLARIINLSFEPGIVPRNMKIARITPIFKSGETSELNNYRPISILPSISKILEKFVNDKLQIVWTTPNKCTNTNMDSDQNIQLYIQSFNS